MCLGGLKLLAAARTELGSLAGDGFAAVWAGGHTLHPFLLLLFETGGTGVAALVEMRPAKGPAAFGAQGKTLGTAFDSTLGANHRMITADGLPMEMAEIQAFRTNHFPTDGT
jgi:hypothetical protein